MCERMGWSWRSGSVQSRTITVIVTFAGISDASGSVLFEPCFSLAPKRVQAPCVYWDGGGIFLAIRSDSSEWLRMAETCGACFRDMKR